MTASAPALAAVSFHVLSCPAILYHSISRCVCVCHICVLKCCINTFTPYDHVTLHLYSKVDKNNKIFDKNIYMCGRYFYFSLMSTCALVAMDTAYHNLQKHRAVRYTRTRIDRLIYTEHSKQDGQQSNLQYIHRTN